MTSGTNEVTKNTVVFEIAPRRHRTIVGQAGCLMPLLAHTRVGSHDGSGQLCRALTITLETQLAADREAAVQRPKHAARESAVAPLMEEVVFMNKHFSDTLQVTKQAAAFRVRQLLDELGMLMGSLPDLRDAFDPD